VRHNSNTLVILREQSVKLRQDSLSCQGRRNGGRSQRLGLIGRLDSALSCEWKSRFAIATHFRWKWLHTTTAWFARVIRLDKPRVW